MRSKTVSVFLLTKDQKQGSIEISGQSFFYNRRGYASHTFEYNGELKIDLTKLATDGHISYSKEEKKRLDSLIESLQTKELFADEKKVTCTRKRRGVIENFEEIKQYYLKIEFEKPPLIYDRSVSKSKLRMTRTEKNKYLKRLDLM